MTHSGRAGVGITQVFVVGDLGGQLVKHICSATVACSPHKPLDDPETSLRRLLDVTVRPPSVEFSGRFHLEIAEPQVRALNGTDQDTAPNPPSLVPAEDP